NTSAAGVIVVLNKRKPPARKNRIVLLNASKHFKKGKPKNYLPEEDIRPLAAMFLKGEAVEGEMAVITRGQVTEADYNLSPSRWAGQADDATHRPIKVVLADLQALSKTASSIDAQLLKLLERA
ncbi:MAG: N-6 DNA methylase, partial [Burkholderiaceae bacterium]